MYKRTRAGKEALAHEVVDYLNTLVEADRDAIEKLIEQRVPCNEALLNHPTAQVAAEEGGPAMSGLLGLINGLVGVDDLGWGYVAGVYLGDKLQHFMVRQSEYLVEGVADAEGEKAEG